MENAVTAIKTASGDTGNIIQFMVNRYQDGLQKGEDLPILQVSAFVAKKYYET